MAFVCLILVAMGAGIGSWIGGWFGHLDIGFWVGGALALTLVIWGTIKEPRWWLQEHGNACQRRLSERMKRMQILLGCEPPKMKYPGFLINLALLLLLIAFCDRMALWFVYFGILVQTTKIFKCFRELSSVSFRGFALLGLSAFILGFVGLLLLMEIPLTKEVLAYCYGFISFNIIWESVALIQDWLSLRKLERQAA
jgi:hypothetical protein